MHVTLQDSSDEVGGEGFAVEILEQAAKWTDERRPEELGGTEAIEHEGAPFSNLENLGEELRVVMDVDALVSQRLGEGIVLLFGLLRPQHVVEEQLADVLRGEARQLESRTVEDGLAELADLRVDTKGHRSSSCWFSCVRCLVGWRSPAQADLGSAITGSSGGLSTGSVVSPRRCRRAFKKANRISPASRTTRAW